MEQGDAGDRNKRLLEGLTFLRQHALDAHRAGDGLLVSHCCSVALQRCIEHGKATPAHKVSFTDVRWAFTLGMYWMTYDLFLHLVKGAFDSVDDSESNLADKEFAVIIYNRLFAGFEGVASESTEVVSADWWHERGENPVEEDFIAFSFALELIWIHAPDVTNWKDVYSKWTKNAITTLPLFARLEQIRSRLEFQTMFFNGRAFTVATSNPCLISDSIQQELFQGWVAFFRCDWILLDSILDRLKYKVRVTDSAYVPLYNLLQHSLLHRTQSEPQTVTQTRRQLARAKQPSEALRLQRDAFASSRFLRLATAGFPQNDMAAERRSCFRLSMLLQLNALRTWDVGGWLEGLQWRSACFLELAVTSRNSEFLLQGMIDAVRSHSVPDPKKQPRFAVALKMMDSLNDSQRERLVGELLNSSQNEWRYVHTLLKQLSDAIPTSLHAALAKWSVQVESTDLIKNHWKHTFLDLWEDLLPYAPDSSGLVIILAPALMRSIAIPPRWSELHGTIIGAILAAEEKLAKDLLLVLLQTDCTEPHWNECRFSIGYNVQQQRPNLIPELLSFLKRDAHSRNNRHQLRLLTEHLRQNANDTRTEDATFRDEIISAVSTRISERMNIQTPSFTIGSRQYYQDARLVDWPQTTAQFVDSLIEAVEAGTVLLTDKFDYVTLLGVLVAKGPLSQARRIVRRAVAWLSNGITGRQLSPRIGGALSLSQVNWNEEGNLQHAQLMLLSASVLRFPSLIQNEVTNWLVLRAAELSLVEPYYVLEICLGAIAGVEVIQNPENAVLVGIADAVATVSGTENAAKIAMAFHSVVFGQKQTEYAALATQSNPSTQMFFLQWARRLQRYATFTDLEVRQVSANIIQRWIDSSFPFAAELVLTRDALSQDCRLRVRAALAESNAEIIAG
jgi:hypothetical protein